MKGFLSSVVLFPVLNFILQWMGVHLPVPVLWQKKNDQIIFADKKDRVRESSIMPPISDCANQI